MTTNCRAHCRSGFTLTELAVATASASVLMGGLASALYVSSRALNPDNGAARDAAMAAEVLFDLMADFKHAQSFQELGATSATFTVPDRDGDNQPEVVRYAWSGTPGDPLTYSYNNGGVVNIAEDVQSFRLTELRRQMEAP